MSTRDLPMATVTTKPGVKSDISPQALQRWNPDIKASSGDNDATVSILEPIGADWYGNGVTAKRISAALRNIGDRDVVVTINSPGGDFFEGLAIYNLLAEHKGNVTVKVLGIAASAASVIAMAADNLLMARAGFLMIHNTWVLAAGDRNAFREVADWLEPFDAAAVDIYQARSGIAEAELAAMLDKETWISGKSSVEQGFADGLLGEGEIETTVPTNAHDAAVSAQKKMDIHLARQGVSRSERRSMYAAMKGGMSGAAPTGTPRAAVVDVAQTALQKLSNL